MKKFICVALASLALVAVSCSKDYRKAIVGEWDAGTATPENDIRVTIRDDGTLTTWITNRDMKPMKGTYVLEGDSIAFRFPRLDLSYRILTLDDKVLVMKWKYARITWHRLKK